MHQTVDVAFQADEDTEIGDRLDGAGDLVALAVLGGKGVPGVLLALLDAEGDAATLFVDIQHHDLDLVAQLDHLGRVYVLVGPVHLGYVNQAFHALFQLGKAAVVGEVGDAGHDAATFRVAVGDFHPGIVAQLLQAQRYAVALAVELENLDVDFLANFNNLGRMLDALPRHVGNV